MACDALRYSGVDAEKWAAARETISGKYGMHIESEHGEESKSGFKLRWAYDPAAQTLEIQCLAKPFVFPCGVVNHQIASLAGDAGLTPVG
ncbi:MAG TPA: hypothetical protein VH817_11880 [Thermoleophilaceae bacterium]|jgi:hypothetical protein